MSRRFHDLIAAPSPRNSAGNLPQSMIENSTPNPSSRKEGAFGQGKQKEQPRITRIAKIFDPCDLCNSWLIFIRSETDLTPSSVPLATAKVQSAMPLSYQRHFDMHRE